MPCGGMVAPYVPANPGARAGKDDGNVRGLHFASASSAAAAGNSWGWLWRCGMLG